MKKRILSTLLALMLVLALVPVTASAGAAYTAQTIASDYFYKQLNDRSKAIYDKLLAEFTGSGKEAYYTGTKTIDLMNLKGIDKAAVEGYIKGSRDLFNDFCAAKDALDLDHSEIWWMDSGYLTFRVTQEDNGDYHVIIGPGRGDTYLLGGKTIDDVAEKDKAVNDAINKMVDTAVKALNNDNAANYSDADKVSYLVRNIHDQITNGIHYRYEIECHLADNAKYIRTIYGFVTHEGVCEAYARTLQVALRRAGIQCVLIHGVQSKGTPEDHMWNAVNIPDSTGDHWYVVDATFDDPLVANYNGTRDLTFHEGVDGRETGTYLLVGQSTVGQYWNPSGYVSTGLFEFTYPTIEASSYAGSALEGDFNGIEVKYSAGGTMEDSIPAGVFSVTYKGMNAAAARELGLYFMVKFYDYHQDGTADVMQEWYYADASFILASDNPYFGDLPDGLRISTATCEYVDIAVTSREPDHRDEWSSNPSTSYLSKHPEAGFFHGSESEIVAQTGMLFNMNAGYEAPPYVASQFPAPNGNATAGVNYRFKVTFDDDLYHILPSDTNAANGIATVDAYEDNYEQARTQAVQVRYTTYQEDLHKGDGSAKLHQIAGDLPFDKNKDGIVDMTGSDVDFKWIYKYEGNFDQCPNKAKHKNGMCDVNEGCALVGVEFNFRASDLWIDDITEYNFSLEGVVGSRSSKFPNNFSVIAMVPGLCPACYRSQGIDWNLWGQPTLLDAPENLDLLGMAQAGGTDTETLEKLDAQMRQDDLNGRLMLVVEDKSKGAGNREEYEEINGYLEDTNRVSGEIAASSVFEINFNRICPMVKLKANAGQSLRVQVGYPAGVTYESLGKGEYELKAFHFTRCDANNKCANYSDPNHKDGDHIVGVDEIQIIPTPYGMVLMCKSFSPFEIVAVKKDGGTPVTETVHNVVVVSDMNGKVLVNGTPAVGDAGNQQVREGGSLTFTVQANDGFVVDTVSFGGESIAPDANGRYTLSNVTRSDVLSVTFLPEEVKTAETAAYGQTVVTQVCRHTNTTTIPGKAATCTENGRMDKIVCADCNAVLQNDDVIPATGHQHLQTVREPKAATCTEPGNTAEVVCQDCHQTVTNYSVIQALGHVMGSKVETGKVTCQGTEVQFTCDRCGVTETTFENRGNKDHNFIPVSSTPATCTQDSTETLKCEWCDEITVQVNKGTALGHKWDEGYCTECGEYQCRENHAHVETLPKKDPTCTEPGLTEGSKCLDCGQTIVEQNQIPATGHTYGSDHKCTVCGHEQSTKQHTEEIIPAVPATCTSTGLTQGKRCSSCGEILVKQEVVPMLDHEWDTDHIVWHWSEIDGVSATAQITCTVGNHSETLTATVTSSQTKAPTCTQDGESKFTASVEFNGKTYTDNDGGKTIVLPATGHTFDLNGTPASTTPATCTQHATKTYKCANCDATEVVTDEAGGFAPHQMAPDPTRSVPAGCTTPGLAVEACAVCGHTTETNLPALGHDYDENGTCTRCGATTSKPSVPSVPSGPTLPVTPPATEPEKPDEPAKPVSFPDVPENAWYSKYLDAVTSRGLIKGDQNGNFNPGQTTSRGQLMTILARLAGVDTEGSTPWYKAGLDWAVENKISDGTNPGNNLTREEFAVMLYRFAKEPAVTGSLDAFPDAANVHAWARDAVLWAVNTGIITGTQDANGVIRLDPLSEANRAVAAAILSRFILG